MLAALPLDELPFVELPVPAVVLENEALDVEEEVAEVGELFSRPAFAAGETVLNNDEAGSEGTMLARLDLFNFFLRLLEDALPELPELATVCPYRRDTYKPKRVLFEYISSASVDPEQNRCSAEKLRKNGFALRKGCTMYDVLCVWTPWPFSSFGFSNSEFLA